MFNMRLYKISQMRGRFPSETLPDANERAFRFRQNPYRLDETPNDGEGQKLTTPGSDGMLGDAPDGGAAWGGGNERKGYPRGISMYEGSEDEEFDDLPFDTDPDQPFGESISQPQYGKGQDTGHGQAMHDDVNVQDGDSALGIHETVSREMNDSGLDRKTDISNMQQRPESMLGRRIRAPYNYRRRGSGPMEFVRESQKKSNSQVDIKGERNED